MPSGRTDSAASGCFLCAYDHHAPCEVPVVEGELVEIVVGGRGQPPALSLETVAGERYRIALQERDAKLLRDLQLLPQAIWQRLRLRVYHLRGEPHASDGDTISLQTTHASLVVLEPDTLLNITDIN